MSTSLMIVPLAAPSDFMILIIVLSAIALFALVAVWAFKNYNNAIQNTQSLITDKELIEYIDSVPDKLIHVKDITERTGMTKTQASYRLQLLSSNGIVKSLYTDLFKTYYTLSSKVDKRPTPDLSSAPFLTTEDILVIMKHFDYKVKMADFVYATGLPVYVLKKELKYFIKEKMITKLTSFDAHGAVDGAGSVYILQEPYRSNPEHFLEREKEIDLELEKLYDDSGLSEKDIV